MKVNIIKKGVTVYDEKGNAHKIPDKVIISKKEYDDPLSVGNFMRVNVAKKKKK